MPVLSRVRVGTLWEYESMKSRETLIRLKKFQVDEKRRRVAQIEGMIADFQRMSVDLEREINTEQERAGINDPAHFAYPTYAKAAIQRRENLTRSADELRIQLEDAKSLLGEAFEELKKVELLDERDQARERAEENAREQADMDSIGLMRSRIGAVACQAQSRFKKSTSSNSRAQRPGFAFSGFANPRFRLAYSAERAQLHSEDPDVDAGRT